MSFIMKKTGNGCSLGQKRNCTLGLSISAAAGLDYSPMQRRKPVAVVLLQISDMNDFKQEREENYVSNSN